MRVLVLRGGPDRERPVSLMSGANVAAALREAGHDVTEADATPDDLSAIDDFADVAAAGDGVVFPVMHGRWGEGGPLQAILQARRLSYVGCGPDAARRCIDKAETKHGFEAAGVPTPESAVVAQREACPLEPPVVVKALDEGSSFALTICHDVDAVDAARRELTGYDRLLIERYIEGRELTVGVVAASVLDEGLDGPAGDTPVALPTIEVVPDGAFYDFRAKYESDATGYRFDIDLPPGVLDAVASLAVRAFAALGCRDLARVDFMVDADGRPWALEVNTMPGFTSHSLLPMAARRAGIGMPELCDRLVQRAAARGPSTP